ncbi:unnamed protein product, partial [Rotaria sp. Silwood1]
CLQLLIVAVSDTLNKLEYETKLANETKILENFQIQIKDLLNNHLSKLSLQCQNYLFDVLNKYNYNIKEKLFTNILTKNNLFSFVHNLRGRLFLIDASQAAWHGNESIVKKFIENYSTLKDKSGVYGTTLLYSAARNNHFNLVKYLIEIGKCSINIKNESYLEKNQITTFKATIGSTPLHAACYYGYLNIVKYLIEHGADYFIINNSSSSIQIFNMTTTNTIQLNSWYNANTKINFLFERAMNYRRKFLNINLDFINNEKIIFDLENFTFNNQQNTITGFIRWIPKIIINNNNKLTIVDNFQLSTNSDLILLTVSYLKQVQVNGNISIDDINQYELKYENGYYEEIFDLSNE